MTINANSRTDEYGCVTKRIGTELLKLIRFITTSVPDIVSKVNIDYGSVTSDHKPIDVDIMFDNVQQEVRPRFLQLNLLN